MSGAAMVGYVLAGAVGCIAVFLLLTGVRNVLQAYTLAVQARHEGRLLQVEKRQDELARTITTVQLAHLEDAARLSQRCDFFAKQLIKLRLRTMTAAEIDECTEVLANALQNEAGPGAPTPGPDDLHTPPADVTNPKEDLTP